MINDKPNSQILAELNKKVAGHDNAKKHLISLISRSKLRHYQRHVVGIDNDSCIEPGKLLLIGASGTGKTFLVQSLKRIVEFPLLYIDATKLNPIGASGGIKSDDLVSKINNFAKKLHEDEPLLYPTLGGTIDRMVVFVDEIDKLGKARTNCNWNSHVQSNFLTVFENKNSNRGVSFVFAGAFTDLYDKRKYTKNIGFFGKDEKQDINPIDDQDLIDYGMLPELIGRISSIVELDKFEIKDYYNILNDILLPKKKEELAHFNIYDVDLNEEDKLAMCKKAYNSGQGIRALQRELNKMFLDHEFNYEDNTIQNNDEILTL